MDLKSLKRLLSRLTDFLEALLFFAILTNMRITIREPTAKINCPFFEFEPPSPDGSWLQTIFFS